MYRMYVFVSVFTLMFSPIVIAQTSEWAWGEPQDISNSPGYAEDHPVILGDAQGRLHVFWIGWDEPGTIDDDSPRSIHYTRLENGHWTQPNSILVSQNDLVFDDPAVDIDQNGILHFVWSDGVQLYYSQAYGGVAESAKSWSEPIVIANPANESSLKIDSKGIIHVVYTTHDRPHVWHIYSVDEGITWSKPILAGTIDEQEGVNGVRLAVSGDDTLHIGWSLDKYPEGWPSMRLLYTRSLDGGLSWEPPRTVTSRETETYTSEGAPWYLNVATDGGDKVFLTWDGAPNHQRYFQQSNDRGATWQPAVRIFDDNDRGRNLYNPIVVDSAGHVHVVTANYTVIRYTMFDGSVWTKPVDLGPVSQPQLAITEGNLLHLVRRQILDDGEVEVWYNSHRVDAPYIPPIPYPYTEKPSIILTPTMQTQEAISTTIIPSASPVSAVQKTPPPYYQSKSLPFIVGLTPVIGMLLVIGLWTYRHKG